MKIAIVTSGRLPVPATQGGAVETKLDYILDYNAVHHVFDITVYSIKPNKQINKSTAENHYIHYSFSSFFSRIRKRIYAYINKDAYYDENIEYFFSKCIKDIRKKKYDCIVLANRPGYALKLRKSINTKIVLQTNNDYLNVNTIKAQEIKESCSLIITCSDFLNKRALEVPCHVDVPIVTVHNGIDIKRFVDAKPIERSALGITEKDFVVFFSGRLTEEKGILELIQALKSINTIPNLKLIIAGASFYGKDSIVSPYIQKLQKEAEKIANQVIFTGFINYQDMPSYLKIANTIVVPSLWEEPFGLTVLEAMAAGIPLIATRCGGIPEICENVSILIERDNICKNISDAISYVFENPQKVKEMAALAQNRSWKFDKDVFSMHYFQAIKKISET